MRRLAFLVLQAVKADKPKQGLPVAFFFGVSRTVGCFCGTRDGKRMRWGPSAGAKSWASEKHEDNYSHDQKMNWVHVETLSHA